MVRPGAGGDHGPGASATQHLHQADSGTRVFARKSPRRLSRLQRIMDIVTDLPRAVLVDIDGTLALRGDGTWARRFYDWHRVGEDVPNRPVVELVRVLAESGRYRLVLMSGRDGVCRPETEAWLAQHKVPYDELHMRAPKDNRKDSIVKRELFEGHVAGRYEVAFILDDRDQVVREWRAMGLTCLQVAEGAF